MPKHSMENKWEALYEEVQWPIRDRDRVLRLQRYLLVFLLAYRNHHPKAAITAVRYYINNETQRAINDSSFYNNLREARNALAVAIAMADDDTIAYHSDPDRYLPNYTDQELARIILQNLDDPQEYDEHDYALT